MLLALILAGTIYQSVSVPNAGVNPLWSSNFQTHQVTLISAPSLPLVCAPFDTSLGMLTEVQFQYGYFPEVSFQYENLNASFALTPYVSDNVARIDWFAYRPWTHQNTNAADISGWWSVVNGGAHWNTGSDVSGSGNMRIIPGSGVAYNITANTTGVTAFDGTLDWAGTSSWTHGYPNYQITAQPVTMTDPAALAFFSTPQPDGHVTVYYCPRSKVSTSAANDPPIHWYPEVDWLPIGIHTAHTTGTMLLSYTYQ